MIKGNEIQVVHRRQSKSEGNERTRSHPRLIYDAFIAWNLFRCKLFISIPFQLPHTSRKYVENIFERMMKLLAGNVLLPQPMLGRITREQKRVMSHC